MTYLDLTLFYFVSYKIFKKWIHNSRVLLVEQTYSHPCQEPVSNLKKKSEFFFSFFQVYP